MSENKELKIAIIGAGSTYTPELMEGIINKHKTLPVRKLYLMDIDERKLNIVGGLCQRMVEHAGINCEVILSMDLDESIKGASFVCAQIRVGKLPARVLDEKIPLKYDLIGQETNGIGGFFKGMRTIPVIMHIVSRMEELCPDAWLINFSNPSGMIAEAVLNHSKIKMMGLCNVPINTIDGLKKKMELPNAEVEYVGLNHLAWITAIRQDGVDYLQKAIDEGVNGAVMQNIPQTTFSHDLIRSIGAIPTSYLIYYYFRDAQLKKAKEAEKSRGELCMEIEEQLLDIYSNSEINTKPELLSKRGGARYSEVAINLVDSIYNDTNDIQVVNVLNNGAIPFMADNDAVEVCAYIGKDGAKVIKTNCDNQHIKDYMLMMKAYEKHAVKAALIGDEDEAIRALLINPLTGDYNKLKPAFDELKEAHKEYLPQFFKDVK
ncbi:MAG: 6-phospho-beta-glucosidase [Bacilli bacterium]|nr:6-phospho-beta-glucosidase [Bacilli bacterium]